MMTHAPRRLLSFAVLLSGLLSALTGCKTIENAVTRATSSMDETFTGKFVTVADSRRLAMDSTNGGARLSLAGGESQTSPKELPNSRLLAEYAQEVLNRVLAGYPYPHPTIKVRITRDKILQASATPEGIIEIPQGLFINIDSEDELAFVLAHEAAHILLNHHTQRDIEEQWRKHRALGTYGGLQAVSQLTSEVAKQSGQKWILGAFMALELIDRRLLAPAWQRSQEEEADLLGVDLMVAAGYNVSASMVVLERLDDQEKKEEENRKKLARDEELQVETLKAQGRINEALNKSLSTTINKPLESIFKGNEGLSADHPTAESRLTLYSSYIYREYQEAPNPPMLLTQYEKRAFAGPAGQALARELNLQRSDGFLKKGDYRKATEILTLLLRDPRDPTADVREKLYDVHLAAGDNNRAAEQLEFAINDPNAEERIYSRLVKHYENTNVPAKELAAIDRLARKNRAKEENFTPRRVQLLYQMGRVAEGDRVAQQCEAYGERRFDLVVQCRAIQERRRAPQS